MQYKKRILLGLFIFLSLVCRSQYPVTVDQGSTSTLNNAKGGLRGSLIVRSYADTTAANLDYIKAYPGALVFSIANNAIFYRASPPKWVQIIPSGSPLGDSLYWALGGNDLSLFVGLPTFGTKSFNDFFFMTNNLKRIGIMASGIPFSTDPSVKVLGIDTITKFLVTTNGGGSSSTLTSIGNGYRIGVTGTNNVKSLKDKYGIIADSAINGEVGVRVDTFKMSRFFSQYNSNPDNWLNYNISLSSSSFTDSSLVNELLSANAPYYNNGIILNGSYSGDIKNSRLLGWNYGFIMGGVYSQKIVFQVLDSATDLSIGIGIDCKQVIGSSNDVAGYITGTIGGSFTLYNTGPSQSNSLSGLLVNKGDVVQVQFNQYYDSVVVYFNNLSNGSNGRVIRKVNPSTLANYLSLLGYPTLYFAKGHVSILNFSVSRQQFDYVFIGNSITDGYRANSFDSSFVGQLRTRTASNINNAASAAATSQDYLNIKDEFKFSGKVVFLSGVFGNDAYAGIDSFATKANYDTIVNRLKRNNNRIVHITNPYRTTFLGPDGWPYLLAENNWLRRTYINDTIITVDSIISTINGYADGTHPNQNGNNTLFNKIYSTQLDLFERRRFRFGVAGEDDIATQDRTFDGNGKPFTITNANTINHVATSVNTIRAQSVPFFYNYYESTPSLGNIETNRGVAAVSQIKTWSDSIMFLPHLGRLKIDTLQKLSSTGDSVMVYNPITQNVGYKIFPSSSGGTVTNVSALTLGTTGTDLSSSVANPTTTPVITLNVPTASATNRGALSSTDWSTFNNKFTLPSLTAGSVLFSDGTTIAQDNSNFFWNNSSKRLVIGGVTANTGVNTSGLWAQGIDVGSYFGDASVALSIASGRTYLFNMYDAGAANMRMFLRSTGEWSLGNFSPGTTNTGEIRAINSSHTGLVIKGATSQSVDVFQIADVSSNPYLIVNSTGKVGIGNSTPNSTLQINGSLSLPYTSQTTTYSITDSDYTIDCTSGTFTVTLPTASGISGRVYEVINSGAGVITIATTSSQVIGNGGAATTLNVVAGQSYTLQSTGSAWRIL